MSGSNGKPDWFEPELATLTRDRFSDPAWFYERKLDGERCLAFRDGGELRLMTRNRKIVSSTYPELVEAFLAQQADDFVLDGEVVAFSDGQTRFAQLQQRMQVARPSADLVRTVPVQYYIFDVLWADGTDLRPQPLRERKQRLAQLLDFADPLRYTEHRIGDGVEFYSEACRLGWEGLIAKRADAPYVAGRTKDWLKFKCENNQEFVIGGYTDPRGSRIGFGALLLGVYDSDGQLVYAGKVGTGFNEQTLHRLYDELSKLEQDRSPFDRGSPRQAGVHWVKPRLVGQVGFSEWTTAGELRHPRFQGLRRDKSPADVIREVPQSG
ncbi:MAG TPA: non-homologous end-joining DNA ligase [Streptosporangiaceae bacterium]|nr:non-homologous end-joining DNA ligase [Streptosporangiaceae bacterium]